MSLGVHAPHLWSPEEVTTRAMDAPVLLHSDRTSDGALKSVDDLLQQSMVGVTVNSDIQQRHL